MARAPITQAELTRYAKAMQQAGVTDFRVIVDPSTGKHEIIANSEESRTSVNEWDEVLE